jgi:hypothetical protein
MSVHATPPPVRTPGEYEVYAADDARGFGWVTFAGVLLVMIGTINVIEGIAAIGNSHFFVNNTHYIAGSLRTWGWVVLCLGVIQWVAGLGIFVGNQFARWVGVAVLMGNAVVQLVMMPAYPLWSLSVFAIDVLAIYGLVAHGARIAED